MDRRKLRSSGFPVTDTKNLQILYNEEFALRIKDGKMKMDGEVEVLTTCITRLIVIRQLINFLPAVESN